MNGEIDYIDYWDAEEGKQLRRPCTPEEQAEIDARRAMAAAANTAAAQRVEDEIERHNAAILTALERIDARSIRPLREGNAARVAALEAEAAALRLQFRK